MEKKYISKEIYSETVRCRSRSALKISHLWSTTACFNPRSLSENSKWCSKPFHHCGINHMLLFNRDFLPPFVLRPIDKSNSETLNCSGSLCTLHAGQGSGLVRSVIYEFAVCCGWTSERLPCRNLSTMSRFSSAFYKHSNTSLQRNQHVCTCSGSGSVTKTNCQFIICLCVCACQAGGRWIFVTVDRLRHSR